MSFMRNLSRVYGERAGVASQEDKLLSWFCIYLCTYFVIQVASSIASLDETAPTQLKSKSILQYKSLEIGCFNETRLKTSGKSRKGKALMPMTFARALDGTSLFWWARPQPREWVSSQCQTILCQHVAIIWGFTLQGVPPNPPIQYKISALTLEICYKLPGSSNSASFVTTTCKIQPLVICVEGNTGVKTVEHMAHQFQPDATWRSPSLSPQRTCCIDKVKYSYLRK